MLDCRPTTALGLADRGLPTEATHVSGTEEGYNKDWVRMESRVGWCGTSKQEGQVVTSDPDLGNYVIIDLKAPTIVKGFRTQGVQRIDGRRGSGSACMTRGLGPQTTGCQERRPSVPALIVEPRPRYQEQTMVT